MLFPTRVAGFGVAASWSLTGKPPAFMQLLPEAQPKASILWAEWAACLWRACLYAEGKVRLQLKIGKICEWDKLIVIDLASRIQCDSQQSMAEGPTCSDGRCSG